MGNHMACLSRPPPPSALNRLQNPSADCILIKFLHCDTGAVSELEGPLTAAEVMLDFPAQFLCCLSNVAASCGRRISAVPADEDLQAAELYLLLPMHRLNSRFSLEEMAFLATLIKAVHTSYINVGSKHAPANRASSQRKVAPFPASFSESMQQITSSECYTSVMRSLPFKPLMKGCTKLQHNEEPASAFNTMPGVAKHALCKSKSWMPKLETVQEHAVAS